MKQFAEVFLGILTAMGGFVEIGELVFSVNAGAKFGYSLLWVVLLGTIGIVVYGEMAGRVAAVTGQPVFHLIRERVGYSAGLGTLIAANAVSLLTCAAETGGVALILKLLVGGPYRLLVVSAVIFLLVAIWYLPFQWIERVFGLLGLLMTVFVAAAVLLHPNWGQVGQSFLPNLPAFDNPKQGLVYAYFAVALMSSIMLPYETYFYAAGAIEDAWTASDVKMNRVIVTIGFSLGSVLAIGLLLIGATLFLPAGIEPQTPGAAALGPIVTFGRWGLLVGLGGMFFAFAGAAIENALSGAYNLAQFVGWPWGKFRPRKQAARFNIAWIVMLLIAALIAVSGVDPVSVVEYSIIFAVVILPFTYFPMLLVARDKRYLGEHVNGPVADIFGWFYLVVITLAGSCAIPLMLITHSGKG